MQIPSLELPLVHISFSDNKFNQIKFPFECPHSLFGQEASVETSSQNYKQYNGSIIEKLRFIWLKKSKIEVQGYLNCLKITPKGLQGST